MKDKHQKHPPLKRPKVGKYHRLEWSLYGTTCSDIEAFYNSVNDHFKSKYRLSYVDADHSDTTKDRSLQVGKKQYIQDYVFESNSFDDKFNLELSQAVFVNGNHFPASRQIVIINEAKKASLNRRVEQLDHIDIVIVPDDPTDIFDFVKEKMNAHAKVFKKDDTASIFETIENEIKSHLPPLKAIILAGGKSSRMKEDKSQLKYHGDLTQEAYLAGICEDLGIETYISKSSNYSEVEINKYKVIKDRYIDMGPFGAILSAFMNDPDAAWLVLACDLPYISKESIGRLVSGRALTQYATAFRLEENPFPEPLIAIYEPAVYRRMLGFLSLGYACPRKVLINSDVKHILLQDEKIVFNANTPEEKNEVLNQIKK